MVETSTYIDEVLQLLEKYLIEKNNFQLKGDTYELILLIPIEKFSADPQYSLVISAKALDNIRHRDVITELLTRFESFMDVEKYNSIVRINVVHTNDPLVRSLKHIFGFREKLFRLDNITIAGTTIEFGYFIKSLILDKLIAGNALNMEVFDNYENISIINAGIIRIERDYMLLFYTGQGLRELFKHNMTHDEKKRADLLLSKGEQYLMDNGFVSKIKIEDIYRVL